MTTNPYFNNFACIGEQNLLEDLLAESIKQYGQEVRYMPRTVINEDILFGEDPLSRFQYAIPVEMYIKNVEGFEGEGDFLSKFGVELRDQITFTIGKTRWSQIRTEKLVMENGWLYQLETANTAIAGNSHAILLEDANGNNYTITSTRPLEGDLIYFPLTNDVFEIKFVEHEAIFYQTGALQTYDLYCEKFSYSGERFDTGNTAIDDIEASFSTDATQWQLQKEDGDMLLEERGGSYIIEYRIETYDPIANNEYFQIQTEDIVDWSEDDPFSEASRY